MIEERLNHEVLTIDSKSMIASCIWFYGKPMISLAV